MVKRKEQLLNLGLNTEKPNWGFQSVFFVSKEETGHVRG